MVLPRRSIYNGRWRARHAHVVFQEKLNALTNIIVLCFVVSKMKLGRGYSRRKLILETSHTSSVPSRYILVLASFYLSRPELLFLISTKFI
jgi:hypothetical protein